LGNGSFEDNMIDLLVIVSLLPLGVKVSVGASGDFKDCAMGGEGVIFLWRFTDL
jgi:hypothetical protein